MSTSKSSFPSFRHSEMAVWRYSTPYGCRTRPSNRGRCGRATVLGCVGGTPIELVYGITARLRHCRNRGQLLKHHRPLPHRSLGRTSAPVQRLRLSCPGFSLLSHRHCPKCQVAARRRWLAARGKELLPVRYFHVVFTLPHQLSPLLLQNKQLLYDLLFRASAESLLEVALDPKHLGAQIGFLAVLHTWGQNLQQNPHS